MEETKNCCGEKSSENCPMRCVFNKCGQLQKCPMMRKIVWIILLIIVFFLGVQYGELKSEAKRGGNTIQRYKGEMMDWNYKNVKPVINEAPASQDETSPEVKQ